MARRRRARPHASRLARRGGAAIAAIAATAVLLAHAAAWAMPFPDGTREGTPDDTPDGPRITVGVGSFDVVPGAGSGPRPVDLLGIELATPRLWSGWRVVTGLLGTSTGDLFGYAGLALDVPLEEGFVLTPTLAAGAFYDHHGKDLGSTLEFRSGVTVRWRVPGAASAAVSPLWVGLGVHHLSNGGIDRVNPGAETFELELTRAF